jgi:hypothetical protein
VARGSTIRVLVGAVLVVGVGLLFAMSSSHKNKVKNIDERQAAPAALISKVTGVSTDTINSVGQGSVGNLPKKVNPSVAVLKKDGKPRVVYLGAEYCPFCAAERWGMVNALSRFGKFKDLKITTSSSTDIPARISTLSFYGSKYDSPYIARTGREQTARARPAALTADQQALEASTTSLPTSRRSSCSSTSPTSTRVASYDANQLGHDAPGIADRLNTPSSAASKGTSTANGMTAAIRKLTAA